MMVNRLKNLFFGVVGAVWVWLCLMFILWSSDGLVRDFPSLSESWGIVAVARISMILIILIGFLSVPLVIKIRTGALMWAVEIVVWQTLFLGVGFYFFMSAL